MTAPAHHQAGSAAPVTILVAALGGEGGGVLAEWLYGAATIAGHPAQATSVPGVAQRTGATTYYVEVAREPMRDGERAPVFSLNPVPGQIDLLAASELLEAARQVGAGMATPDRTTLISATSRALTVAEKVVPGDGRADDHRLQDVLKQQSRALHLVDLQGLAQEAGTAISAVLFGAIAASGVLPFGRGACEQAIERAGKGVPASLRGFALAFERVAAGTAPAPAAVPTAPLDLRAIGRARVRGYHDEAYARLYDERLARLDGAGGDRRVGDEAARWLALWMAFDDVVRVAGLKLAASRAQRVRREVAAGAGDVVKVFDHFKPGVPEFAGLLPRRWAQRLRAWDARRVARGREPWALPLKVGTHTVAGALALAFVASLKGLRARGSRWADEQALIERWLSAVEGAARNDTALALELAACGRLIKGYGGTHERGRRHLLHIVEHLAGSTPDAVRAAREAALADDGGIALDRALQSHGAPPRPPLESAVRWMPRRRTTRA